MNRSNHTKPDTFTNHKLWILLQLFSLDDAIAFQAKGVPQNEGSEEKKKDRATK